LYSQQVIADFLTAATGDPANVNDSPPRGDSALAWQAAQAAIRIVGNLPDPSRVSVSEPVRQAILTTLARYLLPADKLAAPPGKGENLWGSTEHTREILEGFLAPSDMAAADTQLEVLKELAEVLDKWGGDSNEGLEFVEELMREGKNASSEIIEGGYAYDRLLEEPGLMGAIMKSLPEIEAAGYTLTGLGVLADVGTVISPPDSGAHGVVDRLSAGSNGILITLNATTDWVPYWGEALIIATGVYLADDYANRHWPLFQEVAGEMSGVGLTKPHLADSVSLAESEMHAVHDTEDAVVSADDTVGRWEARAAGVTEHVVLEGQHVVTASITSSIGRWF
jgi:hypothetical protein